MAFAAIDAPLLSSSVALRLFDFRFGAVADVHVLARAARYFSARAARCSSPASSSRAAPRETGDASAIAWFFGRKTSTPRSTSLQECRRGSRTRHRGVRESCSRGLSSAGRDDPTQTCAPRAPSIRPGRVVLPPLGARPSAAYRIYLAAATRGPGCSRRRSVSG